MKRLAFYSALLLVSIATWFLPHAELANMVGLGLMLVVTSAAVVCWIRNRPSASWLSVLVLSAVAAAAMVVSMLDVRQADQFAREFLAEHECRSSVSALRSANQNWESHSGQLRKLIKQYGAVRLVTYQDSGLFRYGFMHDEGHSVWLRACSG